MARARYLSDFEKLAIRVGHKHAIPARCIAAYLKRHVDSIHSAKRKMRREGTLEPVETNLIPEIEEAFARWMGCHE